MGRKLKAVGAIIFGVLIVASYIYVDRQSDAILMLSPVILVVFGLEIAAFVYFLVGALWKRGDK